MGIIEPIGVTCLGVVVGFLVRYFVYRYERFAPKALGTTVSVLAGGSVAKFLTSSDTGFWFYPIGVLVGIIVWTVLAIRWPNQEGKLFAPVNFVDEENIRLPQDREQTQQRNSPSSKGIVIIDHYTAKVFSNSDAAVVLNSEGIQIMATPSYEWLGKELGDQIASQVKLSIGRTFDIDVSIRFETQGPDGLYPCSVEVELMGNPHASKGMISRVKDGPPVLNNPFYLVGIRLKEPSAKQAFGRRITEHTFPIAYYSPKA